MTTTKPQQMDGYIRVSRVAGREGPAYISPDVQRKAIERWAEFRKIEIVAWEIDEDESGGSQNRPGLRRIMDRIEAGETDGIACWRINRFARNVGAAVQDIERIQAANRHVAFVEEDIDPTGPFGSFILTVLLAVATLERDNVIAGWRTAQAHAMDRGARPGRTPYGYARAEDGVLVPHPTDAAIVTEAYRVAALDGLQATCSYLAQATPGKDWSTHDTRRFLERRVYIGESRYGDRVEHDALPKLTDRATWEAAQTTPKPRRTKEYYPLARIAVCGTCGGDMVGARAAGGKRAYRCSQRNRKGKGGCTAGVVILAGNLETHARDILRHAWDSEGWNVGGGDTDLSGIEQTLAEAEAELNAFAADQTARRALGATYSTHLHARADTLAAAQAAYRAAASEQAQQVRVLPVELLDTEDPGELRDLFAAALAGAVVVKGHAPIASRVTVIDRDGYRLAGMPASQDTNGSTVEASG